jgi:hypothetical protein
MQGFFFASSGTYDTRISQERPVANPVGSSTNAKKMPTAHIAPGIT